MKNLLSLTILILSLSLFAEEGKKGKGQLPPGLQKKLDSMSEEERAASKEKMQARRAEMMEKMKDMSDDERQEFIAEMRKTRK